MRRRQRLSRISIDWENLQGGQTARSARRAHADCRSNRQASLCPPCEAPTELRFERGDISGDRYDVVVGKLLDHALHQHGPRASALAGRHEVELPRDVHGRLTREAWHLAEAIERQAVTDGTRRRPAIATAGNQKLAFRKAAGRGIGDETRLRITHPDTLR